MAPEGSPLIALAQQGVDAANYIIAEWSAGNPWGEPSVSNRSHDQAKHARSEATSSASGNKCLADNDAHQLITQNRRLRDYGCNHNDLCNVIDDRRHLKARSTSPSWCSPARDVTPSGRGGFHALDSSLRQVMWPGKFKPEYVDKYDGSSNPEEFI
jgi:hypothetical protein